jgi:hypothetical protein
MQGIGAKKIGEVGKFLLYKSKALPFLGKNLFFKGKSRNALRICSFRK